MVNDSISKEILIPPTATIEDALRRLVVTVQQVLFVVDEESRVTGCITDGDIRRALLRGETIHSKVDKVARTTFIFAGPETHQKKIFEMMKKNGVRQVPVLDKGRRLLKVYTIDSFLKENYVFNSPVVIMAGGRGSRLMPYTETIPKPMLNVGGQPVIERLIMSLREKGVDHFFVSVNYLAEKIIDFLGDGSKYNCKFEYILEDTPLGTAGSLSMLKGRIDEPFLVVNGDILVNIDLNLLAEFHRVHKSVVTACAKYFTLKVPYGVFEMKGHDVAGISEKPEIPFLVNSGIYFFSPKIFSYLENKKMPLDMPALISDLISRGESVKCFQSPEPWIDIGSIADFENAQKNWDRIS